jgi:hypothetical protein
VALSGGALAAALAEGAAPAAVPAPLAGATVRAAALLAAGQAAVATPAALLMNEVLKAMLMTKLKFTLAAVMMAALLGAGGLLYQAAGQPPRPDPAPRADAAAGNRPLSELELLRREVEILKLQMEVVQAELRALKGRGASRSIPAVRPRGADNNAAPRTVPAPKAPRADAVPSSPATLPVPRFQPPADAEDPAAPAPVAPALDLAPAAPASVPTGPSTKPVDPLLDTRPDVPGASSPEQEVEAALKAFRDALDSRNQEATRKAAAALEKALKKLRQQMAPAINTPKAS